MSLSKTPGSLEHTFFGMKPCDELRGTGTSKCYYTILFSTCRLNIPSSFIKQMIGIVLYAKTLKKYYLVIYCRS